MPKVTAVGVDANDVEDLAKHDISYPAKAKDDAILEGKIKPPAAPDSKMKDSVVYLGPGKKIYKFSIRKRAWEVLKLDQKSSYLGNIKQFSLINIPDKKMMIMTGGVSVATCLPLASVYEFMYKDIKRGRNTGIKNLNQKRFGHCSAYIREKIFVFGGFAHSDVPDEPP